MNVQTLTTRVINIVNLSVLVRRTHPWRPGAWPASQRRRVAFCPFLGIWWHADFVMMMMMKDELTLAWR